MNIEQGKLTDAEYHQQLMRRRTATKILKASFVVMIAVLAVLTITVMATGKSGGLIIAIVMALFGAIAASVIGVWRCNQRILSYSMLLPL